MGITIPGSVTEIREAAFFGAEGLESVTFEDSIALPLISRRAFYRCEKLKNIEIPASVKDIGEEAFKDNSLLEYVVFEANSSLTSIEDAAFKSCTSLCEINIPSNVVMGEKVFDDGLLDESVFSPGAPVAFCPTEPPSLSPLAPTSIPTSLPSFLPSTNPSQEPSPAVTVMSSPESTLEPSGTPSSTPSVEPTVCESDMTLEDATVNAAKKVALAKDAAAKAEEAKLVLVELQNALEVTVDCTCS